MKTIGIFDKGSGIFVDRALFAARTVWIESEVSEIPGNQTSIPAAIFHEHEIVVAHVTPVQWTLLTGAWPPSLQVFVRLSSVGPGGMGESYGAPKRIENGPWLFHIQKPSPDISDDEWKALFRAIQNWDASGSLSSELESIFGSCAEAKLALRLLCEAKRACGSDAVKDDYNGTGITIYAPKNIWDWLAPFGITRPQDETTTADAQTIEKVAAMLGSNLRHKAIAVLEAVNGENDSSAAIRIFLGEPEVAPEIP